MTRTRRWYHLDMGFTVCLELCLLAVVVTHATNETIRAICFFYFESCVWTGAGSWLQINWVIRGVRSPFTFSDGNIFFILACDFSSVSLFLSKCKTILARPSSTRLSVLSLRSNSVAMSYKRLFVPSFVCSVGVLPSLATRVLKDPLSSLSLSSTGFSSTSGSTSTSSTVSLRVVTSSFKDFTSEWMAKIAQ